MNRFLNKFLIGCITLFSCFQVQMIGGQLSSTRQLKDSSGITEEDFINTMFLKSEFFENWSDTNYFVNPTLKTSKPLPYKKDWYMDYIKDSFASGPAINQPSAEFMNLYTNYDTVIDSYFHNMSGVLYFVDFISKPLVANKTLFLKNILDVMMNLIGSGMIVNQHDMPDWNWTGQNFAGWQNNKLNSFANTVDESLATFDYYEIFKFSDMNPNVDDPLHYDYLAKEMTQAIMHGTINPPPWQYYSKGVLISYAETIRQDAINFLSDYFHIIIDELLRVQNGGSPDYSHIDDETEKILFSFDIVNTGSTNKNEIYQMTLTINKENVIRAGSLSLLNKYGNDYLVDRLNFTFNFVMNDVGKYQTNIETFSYDNKGQKITYENINGNLNLQEFLKQFFSNALIPIFQNRSTFISNGYLDNLSYDTVMLNFFGLEALDFQNLLTDDNGNPIGNWNPLISHIITISKDYYRDLVLTLFDMDNNSFIQGYNKDYGLICNNGFKIYPKYFYYSDKYTALNFKLYSSYNNRFYNTKYGNLFDFDYSVSENYDVNPTSDPYIFDDADKRNKYPFKYFSRVDNQSIGYNVYIFQAQKQDNMYRYYDFNFGIYNWQEITKDGLFPDHQWWQAKYESCSWYNLACHIKNAVIWLVNNIPGIKEGNQLASGIASIFKDTYTFFDQIFGVWKFSPALYNTVTNLFLMIVFMKLVRLM